MSHRLYSILFIIALLSFSLFLQRVYADDQNGTTEVNSSEATQTCIECHREVTPGIVADWEKSAHYRKTLGQAMKEPVLNRKVSTGEIPENLTNYVVGCAECHTANPKAHKDTFEHNGFQVHIVVTPKDCAICHATEQKEYDKNIMSQAYIDLKGNPLYQDLMNSVNAIQNFHGGKLSYDAKVSEDTEANSCLFCHGTRVEVVSMKTSETDFGEMEFPVLNGWPNQGVGRINPDSTMGSCTSCHPRHSFSMETARKPYTCSQCHKGPDVPAYKVYMVSKHGNMFSSHAKDYNFSATPWVAGRDFQAPTCAACHVSLIADEEENIVARRTHQMNDRMGWRLFGLPYAHAHPKSPDTSIIKNEDGLPLPTSLSGKPATSYLISSETQASRNAEMKKVCLSCHSSQWVDNHFKNMEHAIKTTNNMTLAATNIVLRAWENGVEKGPAQNDNIFNETIEKMWVEQWLFYANSTRFAAAMAGADYGVFANGRWYMSKNLQLMKDWLELKLSNKKGK